MRIVLLALLCAHIFTPAAQAQSYRPGKIIRPATNSGISILDPNGDGYVSATNTGYATTLDTASGVNEIYYTPVRAYGGEPHSDLRRGADHRFSDFVPDSSNNAVYLNWHPGASDATTYLRIRMRMGAIIPGAKGFSLLVDTDNKYGASGGNADPNYVAKTTGINGNPGYELEVVLETGSRLAIYNIDGKGNPSEGIANAPAASYPAWQDYSQVSMAATTDGGDPDFFLDWYVTLAQLKSVVAANSQTVTTGTAFITGTSQAMRIVPATIMAAKPSTAGPVSDIYGSTDSTTINWQPPVCLSCARDTLCTKAPVITSAIISGATTTIQGTWTKDAYTTATTATITIYKNGSATPVVTTATVTATSGNTWTATTTALVSGDKIFARAQGAGKESNYCFSSDYAKVTACATRPVPLNIINITNKGISGTGFTYTAGRRIVIYHITSTGLTQIGDITVDPIDSASVGNSTPVFSYSPGAVNGNWQYSKGAYTTSGPNANLKPGSYMVIDSIAGCASGATYYCASGFSTTGSPKYSNGGTSQQPTITSPASGITTATTAISGGFKASGFAPAIVRVYLDSVLIGSTAVSAGAWSYTFPSTAVLQAGKIIRVRAQAAETGTTDISYYCAADTAATIAAVPCTNATPLINVDSTTSALIPGFKITGTGTASGTLKIYNAANSLKQTITIGTDGTWTSNFNADAADLSYYVTLTTGACANIATSLSKTVSVNNTPAGYCGGYVFNSTNGQVSGPMGTNSPLYSNETSIRGILATGSGYATAGTFVKLYVDSVVVGYATVDPVTNAWGPIDVSSILFQGAIVTVGIVQSGTFGEYVCSSFKVICACAISNMPAKPVIDAASVTLVSPGGAPTIVLRNPAGGNFYSVRDSATGNSLSKGYFYNSGNQVVYGRMLADSSLSITTTPITQNTTGQVVATKVGGTETCTDTTTTYLRISSVLPVKLAVFKGTRNGDRQELSWITTEEMNFSHFELERSADGTVYTRIASVGGKGHHSGYAYTDHGKEPIYFYRLKLVDNNGRFKYSNVVVLRENGAGIVINAVRPNPFRSQLSVSLFLNGNQQVEFVMLDLAGKIVAATIEKGSAGNNVFPLRELEKLPVGLYVLKITANGTVYQEKLLKSN